MDDEGQRARAATIRRTDLIIGRKTMGRLYAPGLWAVLIGRAKFGRFGELSLRRRFVPDWTFSGARAFCTNEKQRANDEKEHGHWKQSKRKVNPDIEWGGYCDNPILE